MKNNQHYCVGCHKSVIPHGIKFTTDKRGRAREIGICPYGHKTSKYISEHGMSPRRRSPRRSRSPRSYM